MALPIPTNFLPSQAETNEEMPLAHKDVFLREEQVELVSFMKPKNITAAQKRLFANCKILSIDMKNNGRDRADDSLKKFRIFILGFLW